MSKVAQAPAAEEADIAFYKSLDIFAGSTEAIKRWLKYNILRDMPAGVFGLAGIGKTHIVRQLANELDMDLQILYLQHMDKEDLAGFPFPDETDPHAVSMRLKKQLPREPSKRKGTILFLDEWNRGERPVVNAMFTIMEHPRMVGDLTLPSDVRVVLSGNPSDAQYMVNEAEKEPAIRRRVCWAGLVVSHAAWLKHANDTKFHPAVVNYIRRHKQHLYDREGHNAGKVSANPASWEKISKALYDAKSMFGSFEQAEVELRITVSGIIGMRLAKDFMAELLQEDEAAIEPEAVLDGEFRPNSPIFEQVKKLAQSKKTGATGKINELASAIAITIATTQPAPAAVAANIAKFATLLEGDTLQKFFTELTKMLQEQDPERKYIPLLTKELANHADYRESVRRIHDKATLVQSKIIK